VATTNFLETQSAEAATGRRNTTRLIWAVLVLVLFAAGLGLAWWQIANLRQPLEFSDLTIQPSNGEPVSARIIARPNLSPDAPVAIIAHGFSGNKEMMQTIGAEVAKTLSVRVMLFDFAGHGASPTGFVSNNAGVNDATVKNMATIGSVYDYVKQNYSKAKIVLAGHSMGSGVVARFALEKPDIAAIVMISPAGTPDFSPQNPKNLLILVGDGDIPVSIQGAKTGINAATGGQLSADFGSSGKFVGAFGNGTARRLNVLSGQNHITILYVPDTVTAIADWYSQTLFEAPLRGERARIELDVLAALLWLGFGLACAYGLIFPAAYLLIGATQLQSSAQIIRAKFGSTLAGMGFILAGSVLAVLLWTPLKPPSIAGSALGSYLGGFFLVTGVIALAGLFWMERRAPLAPLTAYSQTANRANWQKIAAWGLLPGVLFSLFYFTFGGFSAYTWSNFPLTLLRLPGFAVLVLCVFPYFAADEFIFRRMSVAGGYFAGLLSKAGIVAALFGAILLNPTLSFMFIVLPLLLIVNGLFAFFSIWLHRLTRDFLVGAILQSLLFAWLIAGFFPVAG
jgi:pimeloyl-ACP methyl ester carboxylesterase